MPSPELISVHLPKTAGSTFRELLRDHYGEQLLTVYDDAGLQRLIGAEQTARAVHGHFPIREVRARFPEARSVIWFRNPVDRLVSYYYYWQETAPHGNPNHQRFLEERPTLETFVRIARDEVPHYLAESNIRDFDFVGLVEHFDEDFVRFNSWLQSGFASLPAPGPEAGWLARLWRRRQAAKLPAINRTRNKPQISTGQRQVLEDLLGEEMALYRQACDWRTQAGKDELIPPA